MRLSNVRQGPASLPASAAGSGFVSDPPSTESPSLAAYLRAIEHRRITGSSAHTIFGLGMLFVSMFDLALGAAGHGGIATRLVGALASSLPSAADNPTTGFGLTLGLQAVGLVCGGLLLLNSPWRRWLRPALHMTVPFVRSLQRMRGLNFGVNRSIVVGLTCDVIIFFVLLDYGQPMAVATGRVLAGGVPVGYLALLAFAYAGTWALRAVVSRVSEAADLPSGDRDTLIGVGAAVFVGFLVGMTSDRIEQDLASFHVLDRTLDFGSVAEFYVLIGALALFVAQYFSTQADSGLETFRVDPADRSLRISLPDCTQGDFKPFKFEVQSGSQQVVLLAAPPQQAEAYRICTTVDAHDATMARYQIINLTQIFRRFSDGVDVHFTLLNGYFDCTIHLSLFTRSPETFLSQMRSRDVEVPIQEFTAFADTLLSTNQLTNFLRKPLSEAVSRRVLALEGGGAPRSDARVRGDVMLVAAQRTKGFFRTKVAEYQNALRSVYQQPAAGDQGLYERLTAAMDQMIAQFDQEFSLGRQQYQGSSHLEQVVREACEAIVPSFTRHHQRWNGGALIADASELLFGLLQFEVADVTVVHSAHSAPVDQQLITLHGEVHAAHQAAISEMQTISANYGVRLDEPINNALASPTTPYAARAQILGRQLDRMFGQGPALQGNSREQLPGSTASASAKGEEPTRPRLRIRATRSGTAQEEAPPSRSSSSPQSIHVPLHRPPDEPF